MMNEKTGKPSIFSHLFRRKDKSPKDIRRKERSPQKKGLRWPARLAPLILGNILLWGLALLVLQRIPVSYRSIGAISVSGVGSQGQFSLPDSGQAISGGSQSPYKYLTTVDPRENYRQIALSEFVLQQAAASLNLSMEEFGEPNFVATAGTTIIDFDIDGNTPEEAQKKAQAFYKALSDRIKYLRQEELSEQQQDAKLSLENAKNSLQNAKQKLYAFTSRSPLKVTNQISSLSEQLESLRIQQANVVAQKEAAGAQVLQVSENLNLSPTEANDALTLLDDQIFQSFVQQYSESIAVVNSLSASLTNDNPRLLLHRERGNEAKAALLERGRVLLQRPVSRQLIERLSLSAEGGRQTIATGLLSQKAEQKSLEVQSVTLDREIERLSTRLNKLSQEQFVFDRLQQDAKLSESIFLSKLAQLNIDKPAFATSYPPLQLVVNPSLPEDPDGASRRTFVLGVLALSLIGTTGLLTLWWNTGSDLEEDDLLGEFNGDEFYNDLFVPESLTETASAEEDVFLPDLNELNALPSSPAPTTSHADAQEIDALSLEQLELATDSLYQHWVYLKSCVEEQEEELQEQCLIINKLEKQLQTYVPDKDSKKNLAYERLRASLNQEIERKFFLDESLNGQQMTLLRQHEKLLRYQQALNNHKPKSRIKKFPSIAS